MALFKATIKPGATARRFEGSNYAVECASISNVYELMSNGEEKLVARNMVIKNSGTINKAISKALEEGHRELIFTADYEEQPNYYIGTIVDTPLKRLVNFKAVRGSY